MYGSGAGAADAAADDPHEADLLQRERRERRHANLVSAVAVIASLALSAAVVASWPASAGLSVGGGSLAARDDAAYNTSRRPPALRAGEGKVVYGDLPPATVRELFDRFRSDYGREYASDAEAARRFDVFKVRLARHSDGLPVCGDGVRTVP